MITHREMIKAFLLKAPTRHRGASRESLPSSYILNETQNERIDDVLVLLNQNGLTERESLSLLERSYRIIQVGGAVGKRDTR